MGGVQLVFVRRQRKPGTMSDGPTLEQLEHDFLCSVNVGEEAFAAASTSSESGSEDGYEDHKQPAYADSEVEYFIRPSAHARYTPVSQPTSGYMHFRTQQPPFSAFDLSDRPFKPTAPYSTNMMNQPTVAFQHPVMKAVELDPFPQLIDFAVSSDSSGLTMEDFAVDLEDLQHLDFDSIF